MREPRPIKSVPAIPNNKTRNIKTGATSRLGSLEFGIDAFLKNVFAAEAKTLVQQPLAAAIHSSSDSPHKVSTVRLVDCFGQPNIK